MAATDRDHDYHILDPSPWPLVGSVSAFVLAMGALFYLGSLKGAIGVSEGTGWLFMGLGLIGILYTMFSWWSDVVSEAESGHHKPVVQLHHRYGVILFIASEVMFFVAWFWAYFDAAFFPDIALQALRVEHLGGVWPPAGLEVLDPFHVPLVNTLILLVSGTTVTWAHHALIEGDRRGLRTGLMLTIVLGLIFTSLQVYEYVHAGFGLSGSIYNSTFYLATGFHGFHVIVGTIFLIVCWVRVESGHFKPSHHLGFESAAWYWHFVDVVWLFLFVFVYVMPALVPLGEGVGTAAL